MEYAHVVPAAAQAPWIPWWVVLIIIGAVIVVIIGACVFWKALDSMMINQSTYPGPVRRNTK